MLLFRTEVAARLAPSLPLSYPASSSSAVFSNLRQPYQMQFQQLTITNTGQAHGSAPLRIRDDPIANAMIEAGIDPGIPSGHESLMVSYRYNSIQSRYICLLRL